MGCTASGLITGDQSDIVPLPCAVAPHEAKAASRIEPYLRLTCGSLGDWDAAQVCGKLRATLRHFPCVPHAHRWFVYQHLSGATEVEYHYSGLYKCLLKMGPKTDVDLIIRHDVHRTMPYMPFFGPRSRPGPGQSQLYRILTAYAHLDPQTSYTQGENFLVAMLLLSGMNEQTTFYVFACLMLRFGIRFFYVAGLPLALEGHQVLDVLLKRKFPKLHAHLEENGIPPALYSTRWLLSSFVSSPLPPSSVFIILDRLMLENEPCKVIPPIFAEAYQATLPFVHTHGSPISPSSHLDAFLGGAHRAEQAAQNAAAVPSSHSTRKADLSSIHRFGSCLAPSSMDLPRTYLSACLALVAVHEKTLLALSDTDSIYATIKDEYAAFPWAPPIPSEAPADAVTGFITAPIVEPESPNHSAMTSARTGVPSAQLSSTQVVAPQDRRNSGGTDKEPPGRGRRSITRSSASAATVEDSVSPLSPKQIKVAPAKSPMPSTNSRSATPVTLPGAVDMDGNAVELQPAAANSTELRTDGPITSALNQLSRIGESIFGSNRNVNEGDEADPSIMPGPQAATLQRMPSAPMLVGSLNEGESTPIFRLRPERRLADFGAAASMRFNSVPIRVPIPEHAGENENLSSVSEEDTDTEKPEPAPRHHIHFSMVDEVRHFREESDTKSNVDMAKHDPESAVASIFSHVRRASSPRHMSKPSLVVPLYGQTSMTSIGSPPPSVVKLPRKRALFIASVGIHVQSSPSLLSPIMKDIEGVVSPTATGDVTPAPSGILDLSPSPALPTGAAATDGNVNDEDACVIQRRSSWSCEGLPCSKWALPVEFARLLLRPSVHVKRKELVQAAAVVRRKALRAVD